MKNVEMDDELMDIFINLRTKPEQEIEGLYEAIWKEDWVIKAIPKYADAMGINIHKSVQILILALGKCTIGYVVRYILAIKERADLFGTKEISMDFLCTNIFPFGFPDLTIQAEPK